ncbi:uracil-DNA glycosylase family protein [Alkalilacustris brevis]|uniref:uracil-DNA glycosylase family protein n=1 Tax=Alkalilacustris brevis TaxID=2026338 RepID=UPI003B75D1FC
MLLVGGYAQRWHLGSRAGVTETVARWRELAARGAEPAVFPLPHPSWRNTAWLRRNPWFAAELLPALRRAVQKALSE